MFLVGFALQKGAIPLSIKSFKEAIKINAVSVEDNLNALNWGRLAADDIKYVLKKSNLVNNNTNKDISLKDLISNRYLDLTNYQNKKYAERFKTIINKVTYRTKYISVTMIS